MSFWSAKWTMPTCGEFFSLCNNDCTGKQSCLGPEGDFGGDEVDFGGWCPSKLKGGTKSIRPILCTTSGLYSNGLDGKLPVNIGEANGELIEVPVTGLEEFKIPVTVDILTPLWEQNVSSDLVWCVTLPESGLLEASTRSTLRLHPKEGLPSSSNAKTSKLDWIRHISRTLKLRPRGKLLPLCLENEERGKKNRMNFMCY